jgi:D-aspartate ligase
MSLNKYASDSNFNKILLIATSDKTVRQIVEMKDKLDKKFIFNYPSLEIVNNLLIKADFYRKYSSKLNLPKTLIYSCNRNDEIKVDFQYPIILKPSNNIEYHNHEFSNMSKVYKVNSEKELWEIISKIRNSGYKDELIIQEFVPGGDDSLFDAVFYCGKDKKVKLMTFAQIGLQERTNTGVGNCTVLVNGFSEYGYDENIIIKMQNFLEEIGYQGFAEFDLKYDIRDKSYKVFEINPRQARSSYYLTACGYNLVKYLIDDLIYEKNTETKLIKDKMLLTFVPKYVIRKYINSIPLKKEIENLIKLGKFTRPLHYSKDNSIIRKIFLFIRDLNYISKYRKFTF